MSVVRKGLEKGFERKNKFYGRLHFRVRNCFAKPISKTKQLVMTIMILLCVTIEHLYFNGFN